MRLNVFRIDDSGHAELLCKGQGKHLNVVVDRLHGHGAVLQYGISDGGRESFQIAVLGLHLVHALPGQPAVDMEVLHKGAVKLVLRIEQQKRRFVRSELKILHGMVQRVGGQKQFRLSPEHIADQNMRRRKACLQFCADPLKIGLQGGCDLIVRILRADGSGPTQDYMNHAVCPQAVIEWRAELQAACFCQSGNEPGGIRLRQHRHIRLRHSYGERTVAKEDSRLLQFRKDRLRVPVVLRQ